MRQHLVFVSGLVAGVLLACAVSPRLLSNGMLQPNSETKELVTPVLNSPPALPTANREKNGILAPSRPRPSKEAVDQWVASFRAADPSFQDFCLRKIRGQLGDRMGSQFNQDVYMLYNLFLDKAVRGEPGFYVDSGANDWAFLSNTVFFDKCLGWGGLCVEPMPQYHANLTSGRSCHLVPECISDTESIQHMSSSGDHSQVGKGNFAVRCRPLSAMLEEINVNHVDFWSLDVEGHEMVVLNGGVPFDKIDVIIMENFWLSTRNSDRFLSDRNYMKYSQMDIDGLFVRLDDEIWYPTNWDALWRRQEVYREKMRLANQLAKDQ